MNLTYTVGLDIGFASVAWCVRGGTHIINLRVGAIDKAETVKEGESLSAANRNAHLMRRHLIRRTWLVTKLASLLKRNGLISDTKLFKPEHPFTTSFGQLRDYLPGP